MFPLSLSEIRLLSTECTACDYRILFGCVTERTQLTRQLELFTEGGTAESAAEFHAEEWRVNYQASISQPSDTAGAYNVTVHDIDTLLNVFFKKFFM